MNSSIKGLNLVLNEKGNLDMLILVKLKHLLLYHMELVGVQLIYQQHEVCFAVFNQLVSFSPTVDHGAHDVQVLHRHMDHLFRVAGLHGLKLHSHQHQIKKFLHRPFIQSHDAGVCKPNEDLTSFK